MGDKNVLNNVSKNQAPQSESKNNESRHTQVFVLPPELLKGLLHANKIPKGTESSLNKSERISFETKTINKAGDLITSNEVKEIDVNQEQKSQILDKIKEVKNVFLKSNLQEKTEQDSINKKYSDSKLIQKEKELCITKVKRRSKVSPIIIKGGKGKICKKNTRGQKIKNEIKKIKSNEIFSKLETLNKKSFNDSTTEASQNFEVLQIDQNNDIYENNCNDLSPKDVQLDVNDQIITAKVLPVNSEKSDDILKHHNEKSMISTTLQSDINNENRLILNPEKLIENEQNFIIEEIEYIVEEIYNPTENQELSNGIKTLDVNETQEITNQLISEQHLIKEKYSENCLPDQKSSKLELEKSDENKKTITENQIQTQTTEEVQVQNKKTNLNSFENSQENIIDTIIQVQNEREEQNKHFYYETYTKNKRDSKDVINNEQNHSEGLQVIVSDGIKEHIKETDTVNYKNAHAKKENYVSGSNNCKTNNTEKCQKDIKNDEISETSSATFQEGIFNKIQIKSLRTYSRSVKLKSINASLKTHLKNKKSSAEIKNKNTLESKEIQNANNLVVDKKENINYSLIIGSEESKIITKVRNESKTTVLEAKDQQDENNTSKHNSEQDFLKTKSLSTASKIGNKFKTSENISEEKTCNRLHTRNRSLSAYNQHFSGNKVCGSRTRSKSLNLNMDLNKSSINLLDNHKGCKEENIPKTIDFNTCKNICETEEQNNPNNMLQVSDNKNKNESIDIKSAVLEKERNESKLTENNQIIISTQLSNSAIKNDLQEITNVPQIQKQVLPFLRNRSKSIITKNLNKTQEEEKFKKTRSKSLNPKKDQEKTISKWKTVNLNKLNSIDHDAEKSCAITDPSLEMLDNREQSKSNAHLDINKSIDIAIAETCHNTRRGRSSKLKNIQSVLLKDNKHFEEIRDKTKDSSNKEMKNLNTTQKRKRGRHSKAQILLNKSNEPIENEEMLDKTVVARDINSITSDSDAETQTLELNNVHKKRRSTSQKSTMVKNTDDERANEIHLFNTDMKAGINVSLSEHHEPFKIENNVDSHLHIDDHAPTKNNLELSNVAVKKSESHVVQEKRRGRRPKSEIFKNINNAKPDESIKNSNIDTTNEKSLIENEAHLFNKESSGEIITSFSEHQGPINIDNIVDSNLNSDGHVTIADNLDLINAAVETSESHVGQRKRRGRRSKLELFKKIDDKKPDNSRNHSNIDTNNRKSSIEAETHFCAKDHQEPIKIANTVDSNLHIDDQVPTASNLELSDVTVKTPESHVQKKRRGRRSKSKMFKNIDNTKPDDSIKHSNIDTNKIDTDNGKSLIENDSMKMNDQVATEDNLELSNAATETSESHVVQKKRRGRPAKSQKLKKLVADKIEQHYSISNKNESNEIKSKVLSRDSSIEMNSTEKVDDEIIAKNNLCDSNLNLKSDLLQSQNKNNVTASCIQTKAPELNVVQKKRPGRRSKFKNQSDSTVDNSEHHDSALGKIEKWFTSKIHLSNEDISNEKINRRSNRQSIAVKYEIPEEVDAEVNEDTQNNSNLNNSSVNSDVEIQNSKNLEPNLVGTREIKRKRGRPTKSAAAKLNTSSSKNRNKEETSTNCESSLPRTSRALRSTNYEEMIDGKGLSDESDSKSEFEDTLIPKKRKYSYRTFRNRKKGRPKGKTRRNKCDDDYEPHHSYVPKSPKEKIVNLKTPEKIVVKTVVCAKCNSELTKAQWAHHNLSIHNDLGWLEGTPKPDYENDEKLVKRVLFNAIKKKKSGLICEECKTVKRSVFGYLSHLTFCGKDEVEKQALMVTCPVCKAIIKPSSLEYHDRLHKMQAEEKERMSLGQIEDMNSGIKMKRRAAEKAVSKISEFITSEKNDSGPAKKIKLSSNSVKKLIKKPQLTKKIPNSTLVKWKNEFSNAESVMCSQPGCEFTAKSLEELKEHYSKCNFTPQKKYFCKVCKFNSLNENEVAEHVLKEHPNVDDVEDSNSSVADEQSDSSESLSDTDDRIEGNHYLLKKYASNGTAEPSSKMFKFLFKSGAFHTGYNKIFLSAFQWTLDFEKNKYKFNLFKQYAPNPFALLCNEEAIKYLPATEYSMPMKTITSTKKGAAEPEWKKWKRFEGERIDNNPTFFVGGPIWALAWLPISSLLGLSENISQYIAISTHPDMDIQYCVGESYSGNNIIQIWDLGELNHRTKSTNNPKLAYAVAHEGGTIWCLDWCPSGCYEHKDVPGCVSENHSLRRMGLLAAACSDGCIRIYSLPFPEDLHNSESNKTTQTEYPVYKTEPALMLIVNKTMYDNKQQTWQIATLSWTKEKEHNVIVAGFTNGYVGLWDLNTKSPMLRFKRNNTLFLVPYKYFFAHHHAVTMVYLVPEGNKQFLATASIDRYYKFWDLEDLTSPKNYYKKSFITNGTWMNHWNSAVITYDDSLSMNHTYSHCLPLRDYNYKYYNIFPTNSTSYAITSSDFGNSIATGTLAGEVLAMFPHQLIYIRDMEKTLPRKRFISMVSTLDIVDFEETKKEPVKNKKNKEAKETSEYIFMPSTYHESKNRFGLKFKNNMNYFEETAKLPRNHKKTLTGDMMKMFPVEQYPFASANRISWNPNAWSFLWLAVGYENGFVRLISFKSVALLEWKKQLSAHIDKLKSETATDNGS